MNQHYLGDRLIFIISQPRSGSTLLQRVLAGHPEIQTSAETWLMLHPAYALKNTGLESEYDARFAAAGVTEFLANYTAGDEVHHDAIRAYASVIYGNALAMGGKRYFLDKTPRYFFIIPELYRLFPQAKFIFLLRNPMAVLASELNTYVKGDWPVLGIFRPDLLTAPQLILDGIRLLGADAITIQYEEFVTAPDRNIAALCERLGIRYHDAMIDYAGTPKPVGKMNDPVGIDQHTRPSDSNMDKWKSMASDAQSRHFALSYLEALGREVITSLGYRYDDILSVLHAGHASGGQRSLLFPWDIAVRPRKDWTFREWLVAERYFSIQKKGKVKGSLSTIRKGLSRARSLIRQQLGRR
jgi:hypothetical protein